MNLEERSCVRLRALGESRFSVVTLVGEYVPMITGLRAGKGVVVCIHVGGIWKQEEKRI